MASPTPKRALESDEQYGNVVDALSQQEEVFSASVRAGSPLSSIRSATPQPPTGIDAATPASTTGPAAKKRKLTPAEKEAKEREKEREKQEKAAQKAQKEEEKQRKLEEKKAKDEEKEEKRRAKDAEKAAKEQERKEKNDKKEAERKAKDEEKAKKERSQIRLTSFFGAPKATSPGSAASSRRGSVVSVEDAQMPQPEPAKISKNVLFLPFEPPSHSIVAPYNRFCRDEASLHHSEERLDAALQAKADGEMWAGHSRKRALNENFSAPVKRRRYIGPTSVKSIIASMRGSQNQPIDLTTPSTSASVSPLTLLGRVTTKQLKFKEDVRPPYIGTYTKIPQGRSIKHFSRKPFERVLPKVDYDYDSEAEWEEPGEGEDLVSEGEEEGDDEEADEMDGFLDDDGADNDHRRRPVADVPPVQTHIHWESGKRTVDSDTVAMGDDMVNLSLFRIETFLEEPLAAIDPYSSSYWLSAPLQQSGSADSSANMAPPRLPLSSIPGAANLPIASGPSASAIAGSPSSANKNDPSQTSRWNAFPGTAVMNPGKSRAGRPPSQPFPPELMDPFKAAILQDKELTKVGLVEVLKKKFPSVPKVSLTETLERIAVRVGERQVDKHWELKP